MEIFQNVPKNSSTWLFYNLIPYHQHLPNLIYFWSGIQFFFSTDSKDFSIVIQISKANIPKRESWIKYSAHIISLCLKTDKVNIKWRLHYIWFFFGINSFLYVINYNVPFLLIVVKISCCTHYIVFCLISMKTSHDRIQQLFH